MSWQPIETAPRDGTNVDLWVEHKSGSYRLTNFRYVNGNWWNGWHGPISEEKVTITHWMLIPAPPDGAKYYD